MLPFWFHIDTFALVSSIVVGVSTTLTLPSIDCDGVESNRCTQVFEQIIAEEKAVGHEIPDVDCGGKDKERCQSILQKIEGSKS